MSSELFAKQATSPSCNPNSSGIQSTLVKKEIELLHANLCESTSQRNHVRLREQARSVCSKLSVMAKEEVNERIEKDGKSVSSGEEDENALLAEDGNDYDTTGAHAIAPNKLWEAIQGLQKKVDLLAGTSTCITDASLKRKVPQTSKVESKTDSNSQPGPSKKKARKALSDSDDASDDSDSDEVNAILGEEEQDSDSSDKLLKEVEEEYNKVDKTGPNINEHMANLINKRFAGKLREAKLKEKLELYVRPGNCEKLKVPLVNHELWGKLKPPVKSQDLRLANVQQTVVKATIALAEATEKISKVKGKMDEKPKIISSLTDSLALLGHATYELSLRRRDIMRPSINKELRALCNQQIPVTDFLLGDDVQSSLKTIK
ncbi:hypothetical protein AWC38_SpisGene23553 [Stylophora pistillata]|uniref:Uncharacterized protein n=1 Tax=Stylophora pistillata TaxID=50429 RepID=A0A2B4R882_STYPI|nr:hypothetical protein AWC38_SpisGene23553 [Stylophora pistillata]